MIVLMTFCGLALGLVIIIAVGSIVLNLLVALFSIIADSCLGCLFLLVAIFVLSIILKAL